MMDFHILIIISCVFLASLFSLLFINKFFRRKTFEEIIAEKKAMTDKIYGQNKSATKKPKKLQQLKKEQKREKKQRQKEQQRDNAEQEQDDSDAQSEPASIEEEPEGLSKVHVEFEPEPEVITFVNTENTRRGSNADKENTSLNAKSKSKKDKKNNKSGILINKNEPVAIREHVIEEQLNSFEVKQPKDVVELKKQESKEKKDEKATVSATHGGKKEKSNKKEKPSTTVLIAEQPTVEVVNVAKELKQSDEKLIRQGSPKSQGQNNNNNNNNSNKVIKQTKKQIKETAATKELIVALDKLSETDTIGVQLLMNLFRRAELNRSEIQILIDYLLNKQQDMPSSHSEWSDDICQKLKRQLEEKERALVEEQEASIGIQAKLRDLRTEVNTERAQMNATIKAYMEKIQSKEQEITGLNQEMQTLNDKIAIERQQFQAKLLREKQAGSQDLLQQLQMMQNELAHKDKCIQELTCIVNASRQAVEESQQKTSELIQSQVQQIRALEQQRDELEQLSNNRVFEIEQAKTLETENAESKVEIRNLQNALESSKADLLQNIKELDAAKAELALARNVELVEKQNEIQALQGKIAELSQQIVGFNNKSLEQQTGLQTSFDALKAQVADKEHQVAEFNKKNQALLKELTDIKNQRQQLEQQQDELKKNLDTLKTELIAKDKKLQEVEQTTEKISLMEKELLQQLQEQKEKNNDLRMKNWKLVEALQLAETTAKQNKQFSNVKASVVEQQRFLAAAQNSITTATTTTDPLNNQKEIRELFQRLYPEAVEACAGAELSLSFDQWIEQVLATHIKQSLSKLNSTAATTSSSHKSTQSNNTSSSNHNSHNNTNSEPTLVTPEINDDRGPNDVGSDTEEMQKLRIQNAQLRANVDELTKLVKKTGNTLSELETHAREQDEHWRSIVRSKDEEIYSLQHSNGEQNI